MHPKLIWPDRLLVVVATGVKVPNTEASAVPEGSPKSPTLGLIPCAQPANSALAWPLQSPHVLCRCGPGSCPKIFRGKRVHILCKKVEDQRGFFAALSNSRCFSRYIWWGQFRRNLGR